jgi:flagellar hook-associated protein 3 FlgL
VAAFVAIQNAKGNSLRVDPNYVNNLAAAIGQSSSAEDKLTTELSSGLRITSLADDPVAAAQSVLMTSSIARNDAYIQAASGESSMLQVTDSTLGEVVTQLTSALTLAVQGTNGTLNAANTASIIQQLTGIRDQVLSLANTSYQGRYLFAGSQGTTRPFSLETSTSPATASYAGDTIVQHIETPSGQQIQVNLPGSTIFGGTGSGVLGALNQLIANLSNGIASSADSSALTAALGDLSEQRSVLDSSLSRLQSTSSYAQTEGSQLQAQQSALVSADTVSVATQLKSAEVQNQALLSVMSALQKLNLFDYIN